MRRFIEDYILSSIQRRCSHPGEMVAVDVLDGSADVAVAYCRRCGAIKVDWQQGGIHVVAPVWRKPDPFLWRG